MAAGQFLCKKVVSHYGWMMVLITLYACHFTWSSLPCISMHAHSIGQECCSSDAVAHQDIVVGELCNACLPNLLLISQTTKQRARVENKFQHTGSYTHSSVFQLSCRAKHWPSSYCFTPNDHQVAHIFLVLLQPIRRTLSKQPFRCWFCLHPPIWQQTILSNGEMSQYLGAGKAAFVCGSCTCRLNRIDTIRQKCEAVKEDLEAQKEKSWHYGGHRHRLSHSHAHKECHVIARASQIVPWKAWLSEHRFGSDWLREFMRFGEKPMTWGSPWIFDFQHCWGSVTGSMHQSMRGVVLCCMGNSLLHQVASSLCHIHKALHSS